MDATTHSDRCQAFRVDPEAWRDPDVLWVSEDLIEFSALTARCDSLSMLVTSSLSRMFPGDRVRSWAIITIDSDGSVRRGNDDVTDAGLCARVVTWLWASGATAAAFRDGAAYVETWPTDDGVEAIACLPLVHGGAVRSLIALWLAAEDSEVIAGDVSRLTLLGRLWWDSQIRQAATAPPSDPNSDSESATLTDRQSTILRAMSRGLTNAQIAQQIRYSESTVRLESMCIYRYFGVHSRGEAVDVARETGEL